MPKVDILQSVVTLLSNHPEFNVTLGSDPRFYSSSTNLSWCAKMHLLYPHEKNRDVRLQKISNLLLRPISSAKDITFAEAIVLWNLRESIADANS